MIGLNLMKPFNKNVNNFYVRYYDNYWGFNNESLPLQEPTVFKILY